MGLYILKFYSVLCLTIDNETNRLATGGLDRRIIVWDLNKPLNRQKLDGHLRGFVY
jgi:hypothetical protein